MSKHTSVPDSDAKVRDYVSSCYHFCDTLEEKIQYIHNQGIFNCSFYMTYIFSFLGFLIFKNVTKVCQISIKELLVIF